MMSIGEANYASVARNAVREAQTVPARRASGAFSLDLERRQDESFIMMVDDNEDDILLASRALGRAKLKLPVIVVRDGMEALDFIWAKIRAGKALPAVALLDLDMPLQSGLDVLKLLRAAPSTALLPVIILTGCDYGEVRAPVSDFQRAAFLRKPITAASFGRVLRELNVPGVLADDLDP